eukprot:UN07474
MKATITSSKTKRITTQNIVTKSTVLLCPIDNCQVILKAKDLLSHLTFHCIKQTKQPKRSDKNEADSTKDCEYIYEIVLPSPSLQYYVEANEKLCIKEINDNVNEPTAETICINCLRSGICQHQVFDEKVGGSVTTYHISNCVLWVKLSYAPCDKSVVSNPCNNVIIECGEPECDVIMPKICASFHYGQYHSEKHLPSKLIISQKILS